MARVKTRHAWGAQPRPGGHAASVPGSIHSVIRTPDQRLRVFISSTLQELADERAAAAQAVRHLRLAPVMFELGARPHAPRALYRAYLDQSDVFVGIYWQRYGWVAPGEEVSGLEDEYRLATRKPKLIYVKAPALEREPRLKELLERIRDDDHVSYKSFSTLAQLRALLENDLALLLSERFVQTAESEPARAARVVSSIPSSPSSFVGRHQEVSHLRRLLRRRGIRLVTLSGPGGVGKTRLSLEVARSAESAFAGGVAFVSLANTTDPTIVLRTIAEQIGAREQDGQKQPALERLTDFLRGKHTLLVLDNFEQIAPAAPQLAGLLAACPELTLLVTSRTALHLRGEYEIVVHPLEVSSAAQVSQPAPAVKLFLERARPINPDFAQNAVEQAAVVAICRQLDGLPLAIELASARAKVLTAQAILARLGDSLQLLTGGARDLPDRQRTLRGTLDWSFQLLEDAERSLFARLAVFANGWTLEAAEAVCQCAGVDVLDTLISLVDKSLIQIQLAPGSEQRFNMLSTMRAYAREKLVAGGDEPAVARAHAEYILRLVREGAAQLRGSNQDAWRSRLAAEQDNIRVVLRWLVDAGELHMAAELQMGLAIFWWVQGYAAEARSWAEELLSHEAALSAISRSQVHLTKWSGGSLGRRLCARGAAARTLAGRISRTGRRSGRGRRPDGARVCVAECRRLQARRGTPARKRRRSVSGRRPVGGQRCFAKPC